jgi:hypothetical protein
MNFENILNLEAYLIDPQTCAKNNGSDCDVNSENINSVSWLRTNFNLEIVKILNLYLNRYS